MQDKASLWLEAGVRMVCVVYPSRHQVVVYRSLRDVRVLTAADTVHGGDVLPGFTCPVADLFE